MFNREVYRPVQDAPFFIVSPDMLRLIFSLLDMNDLAVVAQVCLEFDKRAKETQTHAFMHVETLELDANSERVKKIKTLKVSGTYAAVRAALQKRKAGQKQKEKLDDSCCGTTNMQAPSCRIFAGLFNSAVSIIGGGISYGCATSASFSTLAVAGTTIGGAGGVCLFGCVVTESCIAVNKRIRNKRTQLKNEHSKVDYPKVVVMDEPIAEREEKYVPDTTPFTDAYRPMITGYMHMGMI